MLTVITSYIFLNDNYCGFTNILRATVNGRGKTVLAKLGTSLLLCVGVSLLFLVTAFGAVAVRFGYSSPFMPIQSLPDYFAVPYAITILEYLLLHTALQLAGFLVYTLFVAAASMVTGSYIGGFGLSALFIIGNTFLYTRDYAGTVSAIKFLNLYSMTTSNDLTQFYRSINILDFPVSHVAAMFMIALLCAILFMAVCILFSGRYQHFKEFSLLNLIARGGAFKKQESGIPIRSTSLWGYELVKSRFAILLLVIIVALSGKIIYMNDTIPDMERFSEAAYYEYITTIQNMSKAERDSYMEKERSRIDEILAQNSSVQKQFEAGEIGYDEYYDFVDLLSEAEQDNEIFKRVETYVRYIDRKNEQFSVEEKPIYTTGYEHLFGESTDWFAFVALVALCIGTFTVEYAQNSSRSGCATIIRATRKGRQHTFFAKLLTFGIIGTIVIAVFRLADIWVISQKFILPNKESALFTIDVFDKITSMFTIGQYLVVDFALRIVTGFGIAVLICMFSYLGKRMLPALCLVVVCVVLPEILVLTVFATHPEISILTSTTLHRLLYSYAPAVFTNILSVLLWCLIFLTVIFIIGLIVYKKYCGRLSFRKE